MHLGPQGGRLYDGYLVFVRTQSVLSSSGGKRTQRAVTAKMYLLVETHRALVARYCRASDGTTEGPITSVIESTLETGSNSSGRTGGPPVCGFPILDVDVGNPAALKEFKAGVRRVGSLLAEESIGKDTNPNHG
jgi:hypothetical protein